MAELRTRATPTADDAGRSMSPERKGWLTRRRSTSTRLRALIASTVGAILMMALVGGGIIVKKQSDAAEAQRIAYRAKLTAMIEQQERLVRQLQGQQDCVSCRVGLGLSCDSGCATQDPGPGDYEPPHLRQLRQGGSETEPVPGLPDPRLPRP